MGKLKRKGKYEYELQWHQNHSALIVPKITEQVLVKGQDVEECVFNHVNIKDFLLNTKVPRSAKLLHGDTQVGNIIRYVITNDGSPLTKVMKAKGEPGQYKRANKLTDDYFNSVMEEVGLNIWDARIHTKNHSVYEDDRRICINTGFTVTICNDIQMLRTVDINYQYYINEIKKITEIFK